MTVLASSKHAQRKARRRRFATSAPAAAPVAPPAASVAPPAAPVAPSGASVAGRRRELGAQADRALYTCSCGFVFHAAVSTSVGCPHCGDTQAW